MEDKTKKITEPFEISSVDFEAQKKLLEENFAKTELGKQLKKAAEKEKEKSLRQRILEMVQDEEKGSTYGADYKKLSKQDKGWLKSLARRRSQNKLNQILEQIESGTRSFIPDPVEDAWVDASTTQTRVNKLNEILKDAIEKGEISGVGPSLPSSSSVEPSTKSISKSFDTDKKAALTAGAPDLKSNILNKAFKIGDILNIGSDVYKGDIINAAVSAAEMAAPKIGAAASRFAPVLDLLRPSELAPASMDEEIPESAYSPKFRKLKKLFEE